MRVFSLIWIFRLGFLVLILTGGALGVLYPWLQRTYSGYDIGTWRVFDGQEFIRAEARPAPSEAPLFLTVRLITHGPLRADRAGSVLVVTARNGDRTVLEQPLDFRRVDGRLVSPQSAEVSYVAEAGRIGHVTDGGVFIDVARGDDTRARLVSVDLTVAAGAIPIQPNAIPVGYVLLAIGFVGFVLSFRGGGPKTPKAPPPPPSIRWGRQ